MRGSGHGLLNAVEESNNTTRPLGDTSSVMAKGGTMIRDRAEDSDGKLFGLIALALHVGRSSCASACSAPAVRVASVWKRARTCLRCWEVR